MILRILTSFLFGAAIGAVVILALIVGVELGNWLIRSMGR